MARTGYKARIYVAGNLLPGVQDITVEVSRTEIEVKSREKSTVGYLNGLLHCPIDFDMDDKPDDPGYKAVKAAFYSQADDNFLSIELTNRPKTTPPWEGIKGDFVVTKFARTYPIDDVARVSVSLRPAAASEEEVVEIKNP